MTNAQKFVERMRAEPRRYRVFDQRSPEILAMLDVIEVAEKTSDYPSDWAHDQLRAKLDALPQPEAKEGV